MRLHTVCSTIVHVTAVSASLVLLAGLTGCGVTDTAPPVATPAVELSRSSVSLGGTLEMRYRFTVAPDITDIPGDYQVFVHFLDTDGAVRFTDDHAPPQPTGTWRPGQEIEYDRRMFVPVDSLYRAGDRGGRSAISAGRRPAAAGGHGSSVSAPIQVGTLDMVPPSRNGLAKYRGRLARRRVRDESGLAVDHGSGDHRFPESADRCDVASGGGWAAGAARDRTTAHAGDRRD